MAFAKGIKGKSSQDPFKNEWRTPRWLVELLQEHFLGEDQAFDLDAAATLLGDGNHNGICERILTDAFNQPWIGTHVFVNPPFSPTSLRNAFVTRGIGQLSAKHCSSVTMILGPSDTSTDATLYAMRNAERVALLNNRVKFLDPRWENRAQPGIGVYAVHLTCDSIGKDSPIIDFLLHENGK